MQVTVNGLLRDVPENLTLDQLLGHLELRDERLAIERNREIVSRERWLAVRIEAGDQLEIVQFVGGG